MKGVKLGDIAKIITGKLDANAANENGLYPFFTCSRDILRINKYAYDCECVLVAGNGDLNVKYYKGKFNAYQRTYIIELLEGVEYSTIFVYWYLQLYVDILRKNSVGSTIKYIKKGDLTNITLPLLSLSEQERIVAYLDEQYARIDTLKTNAENQLQAAKDLFQAALKDLLSPKEGWEFKPLEEFCYFINGFTPKKEELNSVSGIPYFKVSDMNRTSNMLYLTETELYVSESKKIIPAESIVFPKNGGAIFTGKKRILEKDSIVDLNTEAIKIKDNGVNLQYLYKFLLSVDFGQFDNGGGLPSLNIKKMKAFSIPIPPLPEQQQIAAQLDAISERVQQLQSNYNETITLCNDLKQALLKSIFE